MNFSLEALSKGNVKVTPNKQFKKVVQNNKIKIAFDYIEGDLKKLDYFGIVYHSIYLDPKKDSNDAFVYDPEYPDRLKKEPRKGTMPNYRNVTLKTTLNRDCNSVIIPLGERYDLIGIDIDNKNDTVDKYDEISIQNDKELTLTFETMNNGIHEYYRLTDEQKNELREFCSLDSGKSQIGIFGLDIDVKYNNQFFFGPSYIKVDKEYQHKIKYNIEPIILPDFIFEQIIKCNKKRSKKPVKKAIAIKEDNKNVKENANEEIEQYNENDKRLELYLNCLDVRRFEDYDDWIKIGFIIFNEKGSCKLYDRVSRKAKNYDNTCYEKWKTFKTENNKHATMKTLIDMAKEDDKIKYSITFSKDEKGIFDDIFQYGIGDLTCAYLFYCRYQNDYIYDKENGELYKINQYGIYQKDNNKTLIQDHINKTLKVVIEKEFIIRYENIEDEEQKTKLMNIFQKIRKYLITTKNKDNIVRELCILYQKNDEKIFEKFDNVNDDILAFNNGVYDLKTNEFRNAKPEELVTCTTGYNYQPFCQDTVNELNKIFESIMPNADERKYLLKTISFGIVGRNLLEEFYLWIGSGGNGKGLLRDLIQALLGEYFDPIDISYFEQTKHQGHAGAPDSIMARKKNCRMVITTEPEADIKLRCAKLKDLAGGDTIQVRKMYAKDNFNFKPKFKIIIQTNKEVSMDGADGGVIRRLRFIVFPNKFVDVPKKPNERKIDRTLKEKIKSDKYKLAFFKILLDHYNDFVKNDNNELPMPERIKNDTQEYLNSNDPVQQFIDERIDKTENIKDTIKSSELYEEFKGLFNGDKGISQLNFKTILLSKGFPCKKSNGYIKYQYMKLKREENQNNKRLF